MMPTPIRVLCVDDNQFVAQAIERRLGMDNDFEWAGWLSHTETIGSDAARLHPHVILLDIDMPGRDAFELLHDLARDVPDARAVMFSGYVHRDYVDRAVEAGAWGYISKNAEIDEVLSAIRQVAAGQFVLTREAMTEHRRKG